MGVCVVVDYNDTWFLNFVIEYLCENKKFHESVFSCSYGAQFESISRKKRSKISWHYPFKPMLSQIYFLFKLFIANLQYCSLDC